MTTPKTRAKKPQKPHRTPREARTLPQICARPRDWQRHGDFSLAIDIGTVVLTEQAMGEQPRQKFRISRRAFNALVDWYNHGEGRRDAAAR